MDDQVKLAESEIAAFLAVSDDENDGFLPEIPIREELVEEVMQQLWNEINFYKGNTDAASSTESCGPSFSDASETVMPGVEVTGGGGCSPADVAGGENGGGVEVLGEKMDGCDGKEVDDEWLARVLSWGPQELDEWI